MADRVSIYTETGLIQNSPYTYTFVPYNYTVPSVSGSTVYTTTVYTQPTLTTYTYTNITTNSFSLSFDGSFNYVTVARNGVGSSSVTLSVGQNTFTDTGLLSNYAYYYVITPYNVNNFAGATVTTAIRYALPTVLFLNYTNITTNSAILNISGSFTNVAIVRNDNSTINYLQGSFNFLTTGSPTISDFSGYSNYNKIVTFTVSGSIAFTKPVTASVLIVGGGGGGGYGLDNREAGGAGGAGGVGVGTLIFAAGITYNISIGRGGNGGINSSLSVATSGTNTTITGGSINEIAYGGGFGGSMLSNSGQGGGNGGSGGGSNNGWGNNTVGHTNDPSTTASGNIYNNTSNIASGSGTFTYYGNQGAPGNGPGGGGGGAMSTGTQPLSGSSPGGSGGNGYTWVVNNSIYGGGGGGGGDGTAYGGQPSGTVGGSGGTGGGAPGGSVSVYGSSINGIPNTGGGGGGGWGGNNSGQNGGNGGSGVVIIVFSALNTSLSFTDASLNSDGIYTYTLTPYNPDSFAGAVVTTSTLYTIPSLNSYSYGVYYSSSISLTWTGLFKYVTITRSTGNVFTMGTNVVYYEDTGLLSDISYNYVITPYNYNTPPDAGISITTSYLTTMANITNYSFTNVTTNSLTLNLSGSYYYIDINTNGGPFTRLNMFQNIYYDGSGAVNSSKISTGGYIPYYITTVANTNLLFYYRFEDIDVSRNNMIANYATGSPVYDASLCNSASIDLSNNASGYSSLSLNATNSQYVQLPSFTTGSNGISVAFWFKGNNNVSGVTYYNTGLYWRSYSGYFSDNVNFAATYSSVVGNQGYLTSSGLITDFTNLTTSTNGSITQNDGLHNFTVEWIGYFYTNQYSGNWSVSTNSDDASYLWIGANAISGFTTSNATVNNGGAHGMNTRSATVNLSSYTYYPLRVQFGEQGGGYDMIVTWTPPDGSSFTNGAGYYYNTGYYGFNMTPYHRIFHFDTSPVGITYNNISMYINNNTNNLCAEVLGASSQFTDLSVNSYGNQTTWHHVCWTLNPNTTWNFYIDGSLNKTETGVYPEAVARSLNYIGRQKFDGAYFNGNIDDFMVYNRILSLTEIQQLYSLNSSITYAQVSSFKSSIVSIGFPYGTTNLLPDVSYVYGIIPYNYSNISGGIYYTNPIYTLPTFGPNISYNLETDSFTFTYDGCYNYVNVLDQSGNLIRSQIYGSTFIENNNDGDSFSVIPNTLYKFTFVPYSYSNIPGASYTTSLIYTLPKITDASYNPTVNSITLKYNGFYKYVNIFRTQGSVNYNTDISANTYLISTDLSNNSQGNTLFPNKRYDFSITPYNPYRQNGPSFPIITYTLPMLSKYVISNYRDNFITLNFDGSYSYVNIFNNYGNSIAVGITGNTYTNYNLYPDTSYSYVIVPYNPANFSGNASPSLSTITLGNVTFLGYSATTTSITMNFIQSYYYLDISYSNGNTVARNVSGTVFTDNSGGAGLAYNKQYTYVITPYNHNILSGNTFTFSAYTLPTLNYLINGNLTTNSAQLIFDGSYNYVSIYKYGSLLITNYTNKTYTDYNVNPDSSYNYNVVPYNVTNISGQSLTINSYTASVINNIFVGNSTTTSNQLIIDGSFAYYNLFYANGSVVSGGSGSTTRYFLDNSGGYGLTPDASYGYYAVHYNLISVSGSVTNTVVAYTLPTLDVTYSVTYNSITMNFVGLYYYVDISYSSGRTVARNISGSSFVDNSGGLGLFSNYYYAYIITPYDIGLTTGSLSTFNTYTSARITRFTFGTITPTSIDLLFDGCYNFVNITNSGNVILGGNITTKNYTDVSYGMGFLTPNTLYTYTNTPYNALNLSGEPVTKSVYTLSTLDVSYHVYPYSVSFDFFGVYSFVNINYGNGYSVGSNITGNSFIDNSGGIGLLANTQYSYLITPFNGNAAPSSTKSISIVTLPTITNFSFGAIDLSSIAFNYSGAFSYVSISRGGTTIQGNTSVSSYTDNSGLSVNSPYTYYITPYNSVSISGSTYTASTYTSPSITNVLIGTVTDKSVSFDVNGYYSYYNVYINGNTVASNITGITYVDSSGVGGIYPNTLYSYSIVPYNVNNLAGISNILNVLTLPKLNSLSLDSVTATSVQLFFSGIYSYINIQNNGVQIANHISGNSFIDNNGGVGLAYNTFDTYIVTPYNNNDISGDSLTITADTLPVLSSLAIGNITTNSIQLKYDGSYSYVNINISGGASIATNVVDVSYTVSGLKQNTYYEYSVIPYNTNGVYNNYLTISAETKPTLNYFTSGTITQNSAELLFDGSYSYVNIYDTSRNLIANNITAMSFVDNSGGFGLQYNTFDTYTVTPFNTFNVSGDSLSITIDTLPVLSSLIVTSVSYNFITINYSGYYAYVNITDFSDNTIATNINDVSYTITNVVANSEYNYRVTPYNASNVPASPLSVSGIYTPAYLAYFNAGAITTNSVELLVDGSYNYVNINDSSENAIVMHLTNNNYIVSGLIPNMTCTYVATPLNLNDVSGISRTITTYTVPRLDSVSTNNITETSIEIDISGYYYYVNILDNNSNVISILVKSNYFNNTGLTSNTTYSYVIMPYNYNNLLGNILNTTATTLSILYSVNATTISTSEIHIDINGMYSYVKITDDNSNTIVDNFYDNSYNVTGLTTNQTYSYIVYPFNIVNVSGSYYFVTTSTLPSLNTINVIDISADAFTIIFDGSYSYVNIYDNESNIIANNIHDNYYIVTGLNSAQEYHYYVTPYNSFDYSGNTLDISAITM